MGSSVRIRDNHLAGVVKGNVFYGFFAACVALIALFAFKRGEPIFKRAVVVGVGLLVEFVGGFAVNAGVALFALNVADKRCGV